MDLTGMICWIPAGGTWRKTDRAPPEKTVIKSVRVLVYRTFQSIQSVLMVLVNHLTLEDEEVLAEPLPIACPQLQLNGEVNRRKGNSLSPSCHADGEWHTLEVR